MSEGGSSPKVQKKEEAAAEKLMRMSKRSKFIIRQKYNDLLPFSIKNRLKLFFKIRRGFPLDYPRQFWLEITNECNLRCIMCPVAKGLKRKKGMMDMDAFVGIIDQISMVKPTIILHVAGEPLLNKNLFEMIGYAKNRGCSIWINTNATLLTKEMSLRILESPLDYISFSFDGFTQKVYEKVRLGAKFEHVKSQIETFLKLRDEIKNKSLLVRIQILVMKETRKQIREFVKYWQIKKVDRVIIKHAGDWLGLVDFPHVPENFRGFGHRPCRDIFHKCAILVDGTVVSCCCDIDGRLPLGNVFKQPFNEIWNGDLYNRLREQHLNNAIPEDIICHKCAFRLSWSRSEQMTQWLLKQFFWRKTSSIKNCKELERKT